MTRAQNLPAELIGHAFTTAEGLEAGLTRERLRRGDLAHPFVGVHGAHALMETIGGRIEAYSRRMSPGQFFSHVTAAIIYGLPLPRDCERSPVLHVCTEDAGKRHGSPFVVGHHVAPGSVGIAHYRGLDVTSPVDTWCQLSAVLGLDDLIRMGDALVRRQSPLATLELLAAGVARYSGHRGARLLREAFRWVREGVDSPKETDLRLVIVRGGLPEPEVNGQILIDSGAATTHGDLVYRQYKVLVEYDGELHFSDREQIYWDIDRLDKVMEAQWRVIRINKTHIYHRQPSVVRRVESALRARGWEG